MDINEILEDIDKEIEELTWKNEGDFLIFLNELIKYVNLNEVISSEKFIYTEEDIPFSAKNNYYKYLVSLVDKMINYCDKYKLPLINEVIEENLYFNELCLLLKYKDKFYTVERLSGQGVVEYFRVYNGDNKDYFIDYDLMINDIPPVNHKEIIKKILENELVEFKKSYKEELAILGYDIILKEDDK